MAGEVRTLFAADETPNVTHKYAKCQVCGVTWAIRSGSNADAQGCSFCDAPANAISIISEKPDYSGGQAYGG